MNVFDLVAKLTLDTSGYTEGLKDAGDQAEDFGKGGGLKSVAKFGAAALAGAGAALVGFGKTSVDTGKEFDSSMSQIAATLGLTMEDIQNNTDGAGDTFNNLRDKAKQMGAATNFSASEAADGLNILAMSGYDAEQSMSMIEDVLHLAAAGSMDMGSAASYVSGAMKGFNDNTKSSGYYANLMAKGATLANTSVSQLGEAMSSGSATAAAYGQDAESMTIALLRLAEQGESGSAAGTALAAAMKDLYTPTDKASGALSALGVAVYNEAGEARDFNDVVNDLDAALADMSDEEANAYKQAIFGIQGLRAYNKMTVTSTKKQEDWADALSKASDGAGEAAKQYDTMTDNLQGDMDIWSSAVDGFKIAVSDNLMPSVRKFVKFGSDAVSKFTKAFTEGGLKGLATEVGNSLGDLLEMISEGLPGFIDAGTSLVTSLLEGIIEALPDLADAGVSIILQLSDTLAEKIPDLADKAADAVVTIVNGIADNADKLIEGAIKLFNGIVTGLERAIPKIIEALPGAIKKIVKAVKDNFSTLLPAAVKLSAGNALLSGIKGGANGIVPKVKAFLTSPTGLITVAAAAFVALGAAISNSIKDAYDSAKEKAATLTEKQQALVDSIHDESEKWAEVKKARKDAAKSVDIQIEKYKGLWEKLQSIVDEQGNVKEGYEDEAELITGELSDALGLEIDLIDGQIQNYKDLSKGIDKAIQKKKAELLLAAYEEDYTDALKNRNEAALAVAETEAEILDTEKKLKEAKDKLNKAEEKKQKLDADGMAGTEDYRTAYEALEMEINAAKGEVDGYSEKLSELEQAHSDAESNLSNYTTTISNYDAAMAAVASGSMSDLEEAMTKLVNSMETAETGTSESLARQTNNLANEYKKQKKIAEETGSEVAKESAKQYKELVKLSLKELEKLDPAVAAEMKVILKTLFGYEDDYEEVGKALGDGIADGLKKKNFVIEDAAKKAVQNALNAGKKVMRISSPSKVWRDEVGKMIGEGLALGMEDTEPLVKQAAEDLVSATEDGGAYDTEYDIVGGVVGNGNNEPITINVYGAIGQDVESLADEVARRFQRMYRKEVAKFA